MINYSICFLSLFLSSVAFGQCTNASLSGAYAYAASGKTTAAGKLTNNSEVGRIVFDGNGGLTGLAARTVNGATATGTFSGSYAVGADCTGTGKMVVAEGTLDFDVVVVNAGSDFAFVLRDPVYTEAGNGTKIEAQGKCNAATLSGTYGYQGTGDITLDGKTHSLVEIGIMSFDGAGSVTATYSAAAAGAVERLTFTGKYELGEDCTANFSFTVAGSNYVTNFVVANGGNSLYYSEVGPATAITGSGVRTNPK